MHAAPPVRVTLGRSRGWVAFAATVAGVAATNVAAWGLLHLEISHAGWTAVMAGFAAALVAGAWAWRHQTQGD